MISRFSLLVLLRLLFIISGSLLFVALWGNEDLIFTRLLILFIVVGLIWELLQFINRTNLELAKFLDAIAYEDNNVHFNMAKFGGSFRRLQENYKGILSAIQQAKIEKEAQLGFLQMLMEQIPVGVIALRDQETIVLMNKQAASLLHTGYTNHWSYLQRVRPAFTEALSHQPPASQTLQLDTGQASYRLVIHHHRIKMLEVEYQLITFQDIGPEMERQELESWQKLIRILTHEIMNSITPLSSLAETLLMMLHSSENTPKRPTELSEEDLSDIRYSLETLRNRSTGLMRFVDDYRRLYKVPTPQKAEVSLARFFSDLEHLMRPERERSGCTWETKVEPPNLVAQWDEAQMQQVFINLATNALQAQEGLAQPSISLSARRQGSQVTVSLMDGGPGIPTDKLDKIFVPFYTTKANGSGIGLSLCRQIVHQHGGHLDLRNHPEGGALASISFPL